MATPADAQQRLQALSDTYQKLQQTMTELVSARQKLASQHQENESVQREFAALAPDAAVYKMVGPVLLKQERAEADMAVEGRLEYISKELQRIEDQIGEVQGQSEGAKIEIMQIQSQAQQAEQAAA